MKNFLLLQESQNKGITTTINTQNQLSIGRVFAWETNFRSSTNMEPTAYSLSKEILWGREKKYLFLSF
jgi:hypothetical protein